MASFLLKTLSRSRKTLNFHALGGGLMPQGACRTPIAEGGASDIFMMSGNFLLRRGVGLQEEAHATFSTFFSARKSGLESSSEGGEEAEAPSASHGQEAERIFKENLVKRKRFFEQAWVREMSQEEQADGGNDRGRGRDEKKGFVVMLDKRVLKTPAKRVVRVPTKALAMAIAAEWQWQEAGRLQPFTMPLMKLATTTIDQVPAEREKIIDTLLEYFHTDSILCHAPPSLLADRQKVLWDPLLDWASTILDGHRPISSSDFLAPNQPAETVQAMRRVLEAADDFQLTAIDSLAGTGRSLLIALAVVKGGLGLDQAIDAIRLEENFQVEEWGFVEGGHDIDIADIKVKVNAVSVFLRLLQHT